MKSVRYSVIIPTLNRAENLKKCLECLLALNPPDYGWEILVVDNDSTDNTAEVVKALQNKNIRYLYEGRPGLHMGRHTGCENASGEILCFIDDDSFVSPGWLKGIEESYSDPAVAMVGGPCLPFYEQTPPEWLEYFWIIKKDLKILHQLSLFDYGTQEKEISPVLIFGCNFSIKKDVFISVGGSMPDCMPPGKELYQGDGETAVGMRVLAAGGKAKYSPKVMINHFVPKTRMTVEYFLSNARYKGIGKSFEELRDKNGLRITGRMNRKKSSIAAYFNEFLVRSRIYFGTQKRMLPLCQPLSIVRMKRSIYKATNEGYRLHQSEAKRDPKLHEWVLRIDYFGNNGKLPGI